MRETNTSTGHSIKKRSSEISELREELLRSQEEILRLRDLLIGKDGELGTLRGRLAELEAGTGRLMSFASRLHRGIPGIALPTDEESD